MSDPVAALLRRHVPVLVIHPHEPATRARPGASRAGDAGWGDYHPCDVEFFLHRAHQRARPRPYDIRDLVRPWRPLPRTGIEALKAKLAVCTPLETHAWELDVADIPSQQEELAWAAYAALVGEREYPHRSVCYGRMVRTHTGVALQYWYLYLYNDFWNNHEADWEMVAIELDGEERPVQIGLSNHHGGLRRPWSRAPREGERPVVYVARGSHAGYFAYRERGYDVLNLVRRTRLPLLLKPLEPIVRHLPALRHLHDLPPADGLLDPEAPRERRGVRVTSELVVVPDEPATPDSDWWWLRYEGKWGSTRSRFAGTIGIDTPWGPVGQAMRWYDPARWLRGLREDAG